jgi:predicted component of type VI protein secretion system
VRKDIEDLIERYESRMNSAKWNMENDMVIALSFIIRDLRILLSDGRPVTICSVEEYRLSE